MLACRPVWCAVVYLVARLHECSASFDDDTVDSGALV
jgi:hypothetical protein